MSCSVPVSEAEGVERRLFLAASLPTFVLYLGTLAPTVTPEDSGELITAAYTLGIAHPPGYPLWCLLGKLFTFIPLGSVAWRVNLLSATLGALAVGVLSLVAFRFTRSFAAALIGALVYAVSRAFWSQAVIAEVYTLNVLLFLLVLLFVLWFEDTRRTRWLYLASSVLGISLTNHSTILPLVPVFFGWVFLRHLYLLRNPVLLLNLVGAFLLGFSIILYLPLRSMVDPFMDWGNPETLSGALDHFLRRQYSASAVPRPRTFLGQGTLVLRFLETYGMQFTPLVAALGIPGAWILWKKDRAASFLLSILFLLTSYGFVWLINYPPDRENLHLTRVFFLPAFAIGAVWTAVALASILAWAAERTVSSRIRRAIPVAVGCAVVVLPLLSNYRLNDQSRSSLAHEWGRNIFRSLKPDSIILPSSDHSTFPLIYLQVVEGLRPDVLIADKYGYVDDATLEELFREREPTHVPPALNDGPSARQRYLVEHSGRPVYFTSKSRIEGLDTYEIRPWGLIFEAVKKESKSDPALEAVLWESFDFRPESLECPPGDFSYDLIRADYHYARARSAILSEREGNAVASLKKAERYGFGIKEIHNNIGGTLAESGMPDLAIPFFKRALDVDPDYDLALRNIANAHFTLKRYLEGLHWFDRVLEREPGNPLLQLGKARAHRARGEDASAYFAYSRVLEREPRNETLRAEVTEFVSKAFGKDSALLDLSYLDRPRTEHRDPFDDDPSTGFPDGEEQEPEHGHVNLGGTSPALALPIDPHDTLSQ